MMKRFFVLLILFLLTPKALLAEDIKDDFQVTSK